MKMFEEENKINLTPVNFFQLEGDFFYLNQFNKENFPYFHLKNCQKFILPDTSRLCCEDSFADVALGWHEEGILGFIHVKTPYRKSCYPEISRGDSLELFFDTRNVKTSGYTTRFCHHFFFLPEAVEGQTAGEITRFRTEDAHELCDSKELKVTSVFQEKRYFLHIFIPNQCLYGYDPEQFNRLGFTYRLNRAGGNPQHFAVVSQDYQIEQQPSLWSSFKLKN